MFGGDNTKRIEYLEKSVNSLSERFLHTDQTVKDIGKDLGYLRLDHQDFSALVKANEAKLQRWKVEVDREQRAQAIVLGKVKPMIQAAEQKVKSKLEELQAEQAKIRNQLKVALQADLHQGQSIRELREEVRALRGGRAGKHEMPEHRIVPYRRDHEMVLYKPPPADGDDWE